MAHITSDTYLVNPAAPSAAISDIPAEQTHTDVAEQATGGGQPVPIAAVGALAAATAASACTSPTDLPGTDAQAARFLQHAGLSSTREELAELHSLGYAGWIADQYEKPNAATVWEWLLYRGINKEEYRNSVGPIDQAIWTQLFRAEDVLRKRVALALSEILVVSAEGMNLRNPAFALANYWDIINKHAFGNYRNLLEDITLSPAMGDFLAAKGNRKFDPDTGRSPDENYAREILQLFSIGLVELNLDGTVKTDAMGKPIETYGQDTITNLAKVFTGWDLDRLAPDTSRNPQQVRAPMTMNEQYHSTAEKRFLGTIIPEVTDGKTSLKMALDAIFLHPNVGPFIGRQLIQRLVMSNPSPGYIERVATAFNDNGRGRRGDMKAVIEAVLLDDEALRVPDLSLTTNGKVREPMLRLVQWYRTFGGRTTSGYWEIGDQSSPESRIGQSPLRAPSVFNFFRPNFAPKSPVFVDNGLVAPEFQIIDETSVAGYVNYIQDVIDNGIRSNRSGSNERELVASYETELELAGNPQALVDHINLVLCGGGLSDRTKRILVSAIENVPQDRPNRNLDRVKACILITMVCPEYLVQK